MNKKILLLFSIMFCQNSLASFGPGWNTFTSAEMPRKGHSKYSLFTTEPDAKLNNVSVLQILQMANDDRHSDNLEQVRKAEQSYLALSQSGLLNNLGLAVVYRNMAKIHSRKDNFESSVVKDYLDFSLSFAPSNTKTLLMKVAFLIRIKEYDAAFGEVVKLERVIKRRQNGAMSEPARKALNSSLSSKLIQIAENITGDEKSKECYKKALSYSEDKFQIFIRLAEIETKEPLVSDYLIKAFKCVRNIKDTSILIKSYLKFAKKATNKHEIYLYGLYLAEDTGNHRTIFDTAIQIANEYPEKLGFFGSRALYAAEILRDAELIKIAISKMSEADGPANLEYLQEAGATADYYEGFEELEIGILLKIHNINKNFECLRSIRELAKKAQLPCKLMSVAIFCLAEGNAILGNSRHSHLFWDYHDLTLEMLKDAKEILGVNSLCASLIEEAETDVKTGLVILYEKGDIKVTQNYILNAIKKLHDLCM